MENVCPNCGGGFVPRPIRPVNSWRDGVSLAHQAASQERILSKYSNEEIAAFAQAIKSIDPAKR